MPAASATCSIGCGEALFGEEQPGAGEDFVTDRFPGAVAQAAAGVGRAFDCAHDTTVSRLALEGKS